MINEARCRLPEACYKKSKINSQQFNTMYISQILQYLLWPALIVISWFAVRFTLSYFEKRFPEKENHTG
jgi:hypothetical protein